MADLETKNTEQLAHLDYISTGHQEPAVSVKVGYIAEE